MTQMSVGTMLTQEQIELIKKFDEKVLVRVRGDLKHNPDKKNDYAWIISKCIKYRNQMSKHYRKNQYISPEEQEMNDIAQLEYERSKYPIRRFVPGERFVQTTKIKDPDRISDKFVELIGLDAFMKYTERCKLL